MKFSAPTIALATASIAAGVSANVNKVNSTQFLEENIAETILKFNGTGLNDYVSNFQLDSVLSLSFPEYGEVVVGSDIPRNFTGTGPTWTLNSTDAIVSSGKYDMYAYTAMIIDAGSPGVGFPNGQVNRHYLANNLTISDGSLRNMTNPVTAYAGPAPPPGSGPHRYIALVFEQPRNFTPPPGFVNQIPLSRMDYLPYVQAANLSKIVAANFFTVTNSSVPLNVTLAQTTAVPEASITSYAASVSASISSALAGETKAASGSGSPNAAGSLPIVRVGSLLAAVAVGAALL